MTLREQMTTWIALKVDIMLPAIASVWDLNHVSISRKNIKMTFYGTVKYEKVTFYGTVKYDKEISTVP